MEKYHTQSIASSRDASRDRERRVRAAQTSSRSTDRSIDHRDFGVAIAPSWATTSSVTRRARNRANPSGDDDDEGRMHAIAHRHRQSRTFYFDERATQCDARAPSPIAINQSIAVVVVDDRTFGVGPCLNGSRDIRRLTGAYARGVRGDVVVQSSSRRRRRRPVKA